MKKSASNKSALYPDGALSPAQWYPTGFSTVSPKAGAPTANCKFANTIALISQMARALSEIAMAGSFRKPRLSWAKCKAFSGAGMRTGVWPKKFPCATARSRELADPIMKAVFLKTQLEIHDGKVIKADSGQDGKQPGGGE